MATYNIVETIMKRDNMSRRDAQYLLEDARRAVAEGEDPEEVLEEYFGLEPDYIFDLL